MNKNIEQYIRKVLEIGCNINKNDNLIIYSRTNIQDFKDTILKLQEEYQINKIIFLDNNQEEIYNFLENNPTTDEIKKFITTKSKKEDLQSIISNYPIITPQDKTKLIYIYDDDYDGYQYKLYYESKLYQKYCKYSKKYYDELNQILNTSPKTIINCPNTSWAKHLFGTKDKIDELWNLLNQSIPNSKDLKDKIQKLKQIKEFLNKSSIEQLQFYTKNGTDFKINLSLHSIWSSEPNIKDNYEYFFNFPSYEICTSPDYNSAEGQVVITKPSSLCGITVQQAKLKFKEGKCISCISDNEDWNDVILYPENNLYRVGEIALVANDTPLAKLNKTFKSVLLDENAGCHLALGNALTECINIPEEILHKQGLSHYNFNTSDFHQDLIFGDKSITVEAKTKDKRKILLMENGLWKI